LPYMENKYKKKRPGKGSYTKFTKTVLCFVGPASLYNLLNETNLVHNLFLVYLSISTCFGRLWAFWYAGWCETPPCIPDSYPQRITSKKCRKNTVVSPDDGPIVARNT